MAISNCLFSLPASLPFPQAGGAAVFGVGLAVVGEG